MSDTVTDIIVARGASPERLGRMVAWSVGAHVLIVAAIALAPEREVNEAPRTVMTISLGGAPGPRTGGLTQAGGRTVQAPEPAEPVRRVERPPAAAPPKMALPDPRARARPRTQRPEAAPTDATARTPNTGPQPETGTSSTETRVRGQGFGLSSSGGTGGAVQLDVTNFCCPEYIEQMINAIHRNWAQNQGSVGTVMVKFTIQRNGVIDQVQVERASGIAALDIASQRALLVTKQLPPLPQAFPNPTLGVHMRFEYQR
jgi:periplasmic protein TonB